jgi:RimJ/RimL family protein N-acetyltransferase
MRLTVGELGIAPLDAGDLAAFLEYRRDPEVARFQSWEPTYSLDDARRLVAAQAGADFPATGQWMQFAIRASGGELLGDVAIHVLDDQPNTFELGITLARSSQGRGVATRALAAVIAHLFEAHGAHRVFAECDARNDAVKRLLDRAGMRHEGTAVDADWFKGEWTSLETWAILRRERPAELLPGV